MKALLQRLRRIWPYFSPSRMGFIVSAVCTVIVAATEPMVPSLMQHLLDAVQAAQFAPDPCTAESAQEVRAMCRKLRKKLCRRTV
jgi:ABC-type multidrug transport system fused ATPase/permease subunit